MLMGGRIVLCLRVAALCSSRTTDSHDRCRQRAVVALVLAPTRRRRPAGRNDDVKVRVHGTAAVADGPAPWVHRVTVIACRREDSHLARCARPRGVEPERRIDCGFTPPGGDG